MRVVVQRVRAGRVSVSDRPVAEIGPGLVILLGIAPEDSEEQVQKLTEKIAHLRIFEDEESKMNRSILDMRGRCIVVSQFTLYADTRKGRRPSFIGAAGPDIARPLVDSFVSHLAAMGISTQTGEFGAHMLVEIENDGPVTIVMEA